MKNTNESNQNQLVSQAEYDALSKEKKNDDTIYFITNDKIQNIPKLQFFGKGSAFNMDMGNTSAFLKIDNTLMLFDIPHTSVKTMIKNPSIFNEVTIIYLFITHLHSDHINGFGDLIYYLRYSLQNKIPIHICCPDENVYNNLKSMIDIMEYPIPNYSSEDVYQTYFDRSFDKTYIPSSQGFYNIYYKKNTNHYNVRSAYYIYIEVRENNNRSYIIYSGDTGVFPPPLRDYDFDKCEHIYIDCTYSKPKYDRGHYSVDEILNIVSKIKDVTIDKITGMHFLNQEVEEYAQRHGLNTPEIFNNQKEINNCNSVDQINKALENITVNVTGNPIEFINSIGSDFAKEYIDEVNKKYCHKNGGTENEK